MAAVGIADRALGAPALRAEPTASERTRTTSPRSGLWIAGVIYGLLAIGVFWHVWSTDPAAVSTCPCGDSGIVTWFLAWPAYAIAHGLNPFYSPAMFHPTGINMLSNASSEAFGIALAPVTWLLGPMVTFNVAITLSPALSALAMFWALRRWTRWGPAAFLGGLLYGFSPDMVQGLAIGHVMSTALFVPPLVLVCLEELLFRQEHSALWTGVALGALLVLQFLVGTEILAMMGMVGAIGLVVVLGYGVVRRGGGLVQHLAHAGKGLLAGASLAAAGLAYPMWFTLAGPAHLTGRLWGNLPLTGIRVQDFVSAPVLTARLAPHIHLGGYRGNVTLPPGNYLGVGVIVVIGVGTVVYFRDRRLWLFGAMAAASVAFSLGFSSGLSWVPAEMFRNMPLLENWIPARTMAIALLFISAMFGIVIDRVHSSISARPGRRRIRSAREVRIAAASLTALVAVAALLPVFEREGPVLPLATARLSMPQWFRRAAPRVPIGTAVLAGVPLLGSGQSLVWQAVDGMRFAMVGGSGPGVLPSRAGAERAGYEVLLADLPASSGLPEYSVTDEYAVRGALLGWRVTTVVLPLEGGAVVSWPDTRAFVGLVSAASGTVPVVQDRALVWELRSWTPPRDVVPATAFTSCMGTDGTGDLSLIAEAQCVADALRARG